MATVMKILFFLVFSVAAGLALAQPSDSAVFSRAKKAASAGLIDPYSVRFEELRVVKRDSSDGTAYVCGTFNAKNRLGAYTGAKPFLFVDSKKSKDSYVVLPGGALEGLIPTLCG